MERNVQLCLNGAIIVARMDFPFLFFLFEKKIYTRSLRVCKWDYGICGCARARDNARSYITECEINGASRTTLLHFGVDNLTLWQLRQPAATAALIADITPRQIVVAATIPTSYDTVGHSTFFSFIFIHQSIR